MKRFGLVVLFLLLLAPILYAGQIEDRHWFFSLHNPTSTISYGNAPLIVAAGTSTGDQVAVNTYSKKTIQINSILVNEYVEILIQGRLADNPYWTTLDTVVFGRASADTSINQMIDVTEHVDFLRVGMRQTGTDGNSLVNVEGLFTNIER